MKDICIVGFGLAGLSIARHAELSGLSFDVVTDASQKSSRIAGGILNPIAIKRMKPVWKAEYFLDYAKDFYKKLSIDLNYELLQDHYIYSFIHNVEQENNWYEALDKPRIKPFASQQIFSNTSLPFLNTKKYGLIKASIVNLEKLFELASRHYNQEKSMRFEKFSFIDLEISSGYVKYQDKKYSHIIFCEGFGVTQNSYFNNLGIYGNKGDYLIIQSEELNLWHIAKARYFLIPLGNHNYKFGATYQRQPLTHTPSKEAQKQMVEALEKMINVPYKIVDQVCGIRPTTKDRRPILGTHEQFKRLHILNGFGSRGVMMSPRLGSELLEYIFNNKPLNKEVSIDRIYAQT